MESNTIKSVFNPAKQSTDAKQQQIRGNATSIHAHATASRVSASLFISYACPSFVNVCLSIGFASSSCDFARLSSGFAALSPNMHHDQCVIANDRRECGNLLKNGLLRTSQQRVMELIKYDVAYVPMKFNNY